MGRLVHAILCFLACASEARAAAPPPPRYVYWVDVRRALVGTKEGKKVLAELDAERSRTDAELDALEGALAEKQRDVRAHPTKATLTEYEKKATELEAALLAAEQRLEALETKRINPAAEDVRSVIAGLNEASKDTRILEVDRHQPLNVPADCNATEWLLMRLEKPGKKPLRKHAACSIKFFLYVDVDRLKLEMKSTAAMQRAAEALREERLEEIDPVASSTAPPLTRFELFVRYSELEKSRRERESKNEAAMRTTATDFVKKTATPLKGVLFLAGANTDGSRLTPSCEVTPWLIKLEHGNAVMEDVAHDCKCVWLNRQGTKLRIARGCGG